MTKQAKKKKDRAPAAPQRAISNKNVQVCLPRGATESDVQREVARSVIGPNVSAASVMTDLRLPGIETDFMALVDELQAQADAVSKGDLARVEAMLLSQACALQTIFAKCANKMSAAEYLAHYQTYGLLALKAQNQCRATLATLADIKNPNRATFIKNTATNQQINVGAPAPKISDDPANELLEAKPHERMDTPTQSPASTADQPMETVGTLHRPKDG